MAIPTAGFDWDHGNRDKCCKHDEKYCGKGNYQAWNTVWHLAANKVAQGRANGGQETQGRIG